MPLDPNAAAVIEVLDQVFPRVDAVDDHLEARRMMQAIPADPTAEDVAGVDDRAIPGPAGEIPVRVYRPLEPGGEPTPAIVYFHGGGWVICDLDTHDASCRRIANATGAVVVSVDYRLAPEHKYPAAADDAYAATAWVAEHARKLGADPARIAIAGDDAGGNLTAVVALMARDRGGPAIAYQVLLYPVIDSASTADDYPSKTENAVGYFLTTAQMGWYRDQYLGSPADGEEPYCSPHLAESLAGLPPACVVTAEMDPLRDEGEHYAALLEAAGVPVTFYRAPGMFHGFFGMDAVLDGAKDAQAVVFQATRDALGDQREKKT